MKTYELLEHLYSFDDWKPLYIFEPTEGNKITITLVDSPPHVPSEVDEIIEKIWNNELIEKQKDLRNKGIFTKIKPYKGSKLNALYNEEGNPIVWPGDVISLKDVKIYEDKSNIELYAIKIPYPYIKASNNEDVRKLYGRKGLTPPRPALGICTPALTTDSKLILTIRGEGTNVYPGKFHGVGGNPKPTDTDVVVHQIKEMEEEILVRPEECGKSIFVAIVEDNKEIKIKPDLIGWFGVHLDSKEIIKRVNERKINERPPDAVGVVSVPSKEGELCDYLLNTSPERFCPTALASLLFFGHFNFGDEWSNYLIKRKKDR